MDYQNPVADDFHSRQPSYCERIQRIAEDKLPKEELYGY
jgi:hypothetical protein